MPTLTDDELDELYDDAPPVRASALPSPSEVESLMCNDEIDDGNGMKYRCGFAKGHDGEHRCFAGLFWVCWPPKGWREARK